MKALTITRGVPAAHTISGKTGTSAEQVLRAVANQRESRDNLGVLHPTRILRNFGDWMRNSCTGTIHVGTERLGIRLLVASEDRASAGILVLRADPRGSRSMIAERVPGGGLVLRIPERLDEREAHRMANQIVATFIVHGHGWANGKEHFSEPHGPLKRIKAVHLPEARRLELAPNACAEPRLVKDHTERYSGIAVGPRAAQGGARLNG
jgi:hypothetical protein